MHVDLEPAVRLAQGEEVLLKRVRGREIGFTLCRARDGRLVPGPVAVGTPNSVVTSVGNAGGIRQGHIPARGGPVA